MKVLIVGMLLVAQAPLPRTLIHNARLAAARYPSYAVMVRGHRGTQPINTYMTVTRHVFGERFRGNIRCATPRTPVLSTIAGRRILDFEVRGMKVVDGVTTWHVRAHVQSGPSGEDATGTVNLFLAITDGRLIRETAQLSEIEFITGKHIREYDQLDYSHYGTTAPLACE